MMRFPVLTVVLIAINIVVFGWQLTFSTSQSSNASFKSLGVSESDQVVLEYGAIPYRLTHPGKDCAVGAVREKEPLLAPPVYFHQP